MFCADYIAAYMFHGLFTVGGVHFATAALHGNPKLQSIIDRGNARKLIVTVLASLGLESTERGHVVKSTNYTMTPLLIGFASGAGASLTLYPFDFVRGGVLSKSSLKHRLISSCSTVPYAGALFGSYFALRNPESTKSQAGWATAAAAGAALAEAPLDHAKQTMFSSKKIMIAANLLYVPFAALMLVMYDKAATKIVTNCLKDEHS